jgi:hypothetical protein
VEPDARYNRDWRHELPVVRAGINDEEDGLLGVLRP